MTKPNNFEKEVTEVLVKVNEITRNQFIIDLLILIQGINFINHPEEAHKGIIQSLAITMFFAALSIIIGFILLHGFKKRNINSILLALFFIVLSIILYLTADYLAPAFHYFLASAIIISGFINILSVYHLVKLNHARKILKSKITSAEKENQTTQGVSNALEKTTKLEAERILSPAVAFSVKVNKFRYGQLLINIILITIGFLMIFFRFSTNAVLIRISGGILIFSALSDLISLIWTHHESNLAKKITHYSSAATKQNKKR